MASPRVELPFELRSRIAPKVSVEAGHIVVTLEVKGVRNPDDLRDLMVALERKSAEQLAFDLLSAARKLG